MASVFSVDVRPLVALYKALSDEHRLRMVAMLSLGELCVCHLEAALEAPQPTVSRHLAILRAAGVVETRRDGSWIYYRLAQLADVEAQRQLDSLVASYADRSTLKREINRIKKACGPNACC